MIKDSKEDNKKTYMLNFFRKIQKPGIGIKWSLQNCKLSNKIKKSLQKKSYEDSYDDVWSLKMPTCVFYFTQLCKILYKHAFLFRQNLKKEMMMMIMTLFRKFIEILFSTLSSHEMTFRELLSIKINWTFTILYKRKVMKKVTMWLEERQ